MQTIFASPEVIEKWCAALRSGEYQKGVGRLQDDKGNYCCLGVLQMILSGEVERDPETEDNMALFTSLTKLG